MRDNEYWAEQSPQISDITLRCVVCGSPRGGISPVDGLFYCVEHMPDDVVVLA